MTTKFSSDTEDYFTAFDYGDSGSSFRGFTDSDYLGSFHKNILFEPKTTIVDVAQDLVPS